MRSSERRPSVTHAACYADSAASMAATGAASLSLGVRLLRTTLLSDHVQNIMLPDIKIRDSFVCPVFYQIDGIRPVFFAIDGISPVFLGDLQRASPNSTESIPSRLC